MSRVTVITDAKGQIQAVAPGHLSEATSRKSGTKGIQGGIRALPGQKLHELDVPFDVTQAKTWNDVVEKIRPHVKAL